MSLDLSCKYRVSRQSIVARLGKTAKSIDSAPCLLSIRSGVQASPGSPFVNSGNIVNSRRKAGISLQLHNVSKGDYGWLKVSARDFLSCTCRVSANSSDPWTSSINHSISGPTDAPLQRTHNHPAIPEIRQVTRCPRCRREYCCCPTGTRRAA
jgi:hypothetical protein